MRAGKCRSCGKTERLEGERLSAGLCSACRPCCECGAIRDGRRFQGRRCSKCAWAVKKNKMNSRCECGTVGINSTGKCATCSPFNKFGRRVNPVGNKMLSLLDRVSELAEAREMEPVRFLAEILENYDMDQRRLLATRHAPEFLGRRYSSFGAENE